MRLGDVLRKERERRGLTVEDIESRLSFPSEEYREIEGGNSAAEEWAPRLALIAIALRTPTSRLISETGKAVANDRSDVTCGSLIRLHRQARGLSLQELARKMDVDVSKVEEIENGTSPLEKYGPLLLAFAEAIEQPIFNLFYPAGLPFCELSDYP